MVEIAGNKLGDGPLISPEKGLNSFFDFIFSLKLLTLKCLIILRKGSGKQMTIQTNDEPV